jgi:hypothetical protein
VTDIDLDVLHATAFQGRGRERDALGVGCQTAGADQLTPGLEALPPPSRVGRLVAEDRARIAETKRKRSLVELRGNHASHAHGAFAHQRQQGAIRVHEAEERRLLGSRDTRGDGVQRLDQRGDHEAVPPRFEGLDEPIREEAAPSCRADQVVGEAVSAPTNRCAGRERVEACHAGILRAAHD